MTTTMYPPAPLDSTNYRWWTAAGNFYPVNISGGYELDDGDVAEATAQGFTLEQPENLDSINQAVAQSAETEVDMFTTIPGDSQ